MVALELVKQVANKIHTVDLSEIYKLTDIVNNHFLNSNNQQCSSEATLPENYLTSTGFEVLDC